MFNFRNFLEERRYANSATREFLSTRSKPYEYWMSKRWAIPFPISGPMMKRLETSERQEALHFTDLDGLKSLFDIEGSAKSISVITWIQEIDFAIELLDGIDTSGGIAVEVTGDIALRAEGDIFTEVDNQGRRWVDLRQFRSQVSKSDNPDFIVEYEKKYHDIVRKITKVFFTDRMRADLVKLDYFVDVKYLNIILSSMDQMKVIWNTIKGEIRSNARMKGLDLRLYNDVDREINRSLFRITKELFDMAEEHLYKNITTLWEILADPGGVKPWYDEGVMDHFKVTAVNWDVDTIGNTEEVEELVDSYGKSNLRVVPVYDEGTWRIILKKWVGRKSTLNL